MKRISIAVVLSLTTVTASSASPGAPMLHVVGLERGSGSPVGRGGVLFVTEGTAGRVSRVGPQTGAITTFASGLPQSITPNAGAMDVAFIGSTAYVLVTLVGSDVGGTDIVGTYHVDAPSGFRGEFALLDPPATDFFVLPRAPDGPAIHVLPPAFRLPRCGRLPGVPALPGPAPKGEQCE